jgi:hypothetical protein
MAAAFARGWLRAGCSESLIQSGQKVSRLAEFGRRWFRTFAMNVSQIYDNDDEPVEMKIDLEGTPQ